MTAPEFNRRIAALGYSQRGFASFVGANERTVRRWALSEQDIPPWVDVVLSLKEQIASCGLSQPAAPTRRSA